MGVGNRLALERAVGFAGGQGQGACGPSMGISKGRWCLVEAQGWLLRVAHHRGALGVGLL